MGSTQGLLSFHTPIRWQARVGATLTGVSFFPVCARLGCAVSVFPMLSASRWHLPSPSTPPSISSTADHETNDTHDRGVMGRVYIAMVKPGTPGHEIEYG